MIDFSKYCLEFEDYCAQSCKHFKTQEEADRFYYIWIEGFDFAKFIDY